jgi:hypothetical protein
MKRHSVYFKVMMTIALIMLAAFVLLLVLAVLPGLAALFCVFSFITWYAGIMAPDHEKYVQS